MAGRSRGDWNEGLREPRFCHHRAFSFFSITHKPREILGLTLAVLYQILEEGRGREEMEEERKRDEKRDIGRERVPEDGRSAKRGLMRIKGFVGPAFTTIGHCGCLIHYNF